MRVKFKPFFKLTRKYRTWAKRINYESRTTNRLFQINRNHLS